MLDIELCEIMLDHNFPFTHQCFYYAYNTLSENRIPFLKWYICRGLPIIQGYVPTKKDIEELQIPVISPETNTILHTKLTIIEPLLKKMEHKDDMYKIMLVENTKGEKTVCKEMDEEELYMYSIFLDYPHKNIPQALQTFYGVNIHKRIACYIQLEYYPYTLGTYPLQDISLSEKRKLIRQIMEGVYMIHKLGYYHGDLKPENICITSDNIVKIIDFETCDKKKTTCRDKNSFPFMTPDSYYNRVDSMLNYNECGVRNDIYVMSLLILYILSNKMNSYDTFLASTNKNNKCRKNETEMIYQVELTDGKLWFDLYGLDDADDMLTYQQIEYIVATLQNKEDKRPSSLKPEYFL